MTQIDSNLDHVVIVVSNLEKAIEHCQALGFTVSLGGQNGPTQNALIAFIDGTYLELINVRSGIARLFFRLLYRSGMLTLFKPLLPSLSARILGWLGGGSGVRDWCIRTDNVEHTKESLNALDIPIGPIKEFARTKPNLEVAKWLLAAPVDHELPFMIQDISNISVRIPSGADATHANGIQGISRLLLQGSSYSKSFTDLQKLLLNIKNQGDIANGTKVAIDPVLTSKIAIELVGPESENRVLEMIQREHFRLVFSAPR